MNMYNALRSLVFVAPLALCFAAGCGDSSEDTTPSESGSDTLTIVAAIESGTPVVGQNAMIVTVTDAEGASVVGATVGVDPQMPSMGHGSSEEPVITDNGDGTYRAFPVTFQMGGPWTVTIDATAGDASGQLVVDYNVAGGMGSGGM